MPAKTGKMDTFQNKAFWKNYYEAEVSTTHITAEKISGISI